MSDEKDKILVVVGKLTKYAHFIGMKKSDSVKDIVEIFCKNVYKLHGFPKVIVSDRDPKFKGNFWKDFSNQARISLNMRLAYHSQTDRHTKIVNKCLETYLHCFSTDKQKTWSKWLHLAEWW